MAVIVWQYALPPVVMAQGSLEDYKTAVALYNQSRWPKAAEQFRLFLKTSDKRHEKVPIARLYLGLTLVNMEEFKAARDELRSFVNDYPQNSNIPQARYRIAECSYLLEDMVSARAELKEYLKDFPKDQFQDHAIPYLADTQLRLNDPMSALANFQLAIERFPEGPLIEDARFGRARALEMLDRDDEALAQYKEIAGRPNSSRAADAQFHWGALIFERKQYPEAAAVYVDLAKKYPKSRLIHIAHLNAGYAYFELGNFGAAIPQFEAAATEKSQRVTANYWLGRSLKSAGQHAKAVEALKVAAAEAGDLPLGESILFQEALCERHLGHAAEAKQLFETVLEKWSKGDFADDSLHALTELSIEAGNLSAAEQYLKRFAKDYPDSGLRLHVELLNGRLELGRAAVAVRDRKPANEIAAQYETAAKLFSNVLANSSIPLTKNQARYYLAFVRELQGQYAQALELITPVVEFIRADGAKSELVDAFVLQADALLAEKKYDEADKAVQEYLTISPNGRQRARAISIQTVAAAQRNDHTKVDSAIEQLKSEFPDHPLRAVTIQRLAELAELREDWMSTARFYELLIPLQAGHESQPFSIRGLANAQMKQKQFDAAANTYSRVIQEFPNHRLAFECAYLRADALKEAGKINESIEAFEELLRKMPADKPAEPGTEQQIPWVFSYKAGLQAARLYSKASRVKEADLAYEELIKRFPKPKGLDRLFDEWALLNYDAGPKDKTRYERADQIFRRIIEETPDSDLVDNARLSLADSDRMAGRSDVARQAYEQLLASDKSDTDVKEWSLYQLLILAVEQQRWDDVRRFADRLIAEFPTSPRRWYASYSIIEAILSNLKATDQELEAARARLNALRNEQANPDLNSLEWYDRTWVLLAEVNFRQKKYDELEAIVNELRGRPTKSPFLYQADEVLGRGFKQQAPPKFDEALKAFERVVTDDDAKSTETAAKCQFLIGETLFLQEKWPEAFLAYQKVYAAYDFPDWQSAALLQSGKCDEKQQLWKDAATTYRFLMERFPKSAHAADAKLRLEAISKMPGG